MAARAIPVAAIPTPIPSRRRFHLGSLPTSTTSNFKSPIFRSATRKTGGAFVISALGRRRGGGKKNNAPEDGELDEEEEEEEVVVMGWDYDDDDDEEDGSTPFDWMRKWMRNRPVGFGEGKAYDVSLEEELLEEMERSRKAQAANINKLKGCRGDTAEVAQKQQQTKKKQPQIKVADVPPSGVRVRIGNLPKKRSIHRDLQSAFKVFPGINNIMPATIGNKKTRDPVCRGFAFVDFESEEVANRFVKAYSKQRLAFGKVEKQITCHILSLGCSANSGSESMNSETTIVAEGAYLNSDIRTSMKCQDENSGGYNGNELNERELLHVSSDNLPQVSSQSGHTEINIESSDVSIRNFGEGAGCRNEGDPVLEKSLVSVDTRKKSDGVPKNKTKKTKPQKGPKVNVPGSANRLKVKERDVLIDVFSKYGGKATAPSK